MGLKRNTFPKKNALEGKYANYFKVGHNAFEFVLDFGQYYPGNDQAKLITRVITSPKYVKTFSRTLLEALKQFEMLYGTIEDE